MNLRFYQSFLKRCCDNPDITTAPAVRGKIAHPGLHQGEHYRGGAMAVLSAARQSIDADRVVLFDELTGLKPQQDKRAWGGPVFSVRMILPQRLSET